MKLRALLAIALLILLPAIANAGGETGNGRGASISAPVALERLI